jgi:hypothetical protein
MSRPLRVPDNGSGDNVVTILKRLRDRAEAIQHNLGVDDTYVRRECVAILAQIDTLLRGLGGKKGDMGLTTLN